MNELRKQLKKWWNKQKIFITQNEQNIEDVKAAVDQIVSCFTQEQLDILEIPLDSGYKPSFRAWLINVNKNKFVCCEISDVKTLAYNKVMEFQIRLKQNKNLVNAYKTFKFPEIFKENCDCKPNTIVKRERLKNFFWNCAYFYKWIKN